jgi:hypothetical protein
MEEKKELYRREGLRLIELYPKDERDLAEALSRDLRKYHIPPGGSPESCGGTFAWISRVWRRLVSRE